MAKVKTVNVGLIGAGRIGSFHGESVARRIVDAELVAIADPAPGAAAKLAEILDVDASYTDVAEMLAHPSLDAVIIATPARFHTNVLVQAAEAGKAVFCEKPMALTLEDADRGIAAAKAAGVPLQVGFNRRWDQAFAEGRAAIDAGKVGAPQLIRSLTRDPGPFGADPDRIPLWTVFYETLIHDFDTLLWLNPGAKPVEVFAMADALVRPDARDKGFLDTAVVNIRFDNGSIAVAEANFCAMYGYDIRGEVFGSGGMITMGDVRRSSMTLFDKDGVSNDTWRRDTDHFVQGYTAQLASFVEAVRDGEIKDAPTGADARNALAIALAAIESVSKKQPFRMG
ncbi:MULTISPECIES: Gfo/Idh/MocA family oxidoreductase [Agrobacterium]|jgi:myo-inositol 2-dehydrogenase/D-chiro-inositol 1-dehydrogenase|uniref:Myo-inositol 2-dehydrogenase/D-chiro-inositol 1-dehydrogenase n=1 Tax=Agrobacterium tumefaciens TaxID=358 RepID=A0AAW8M0T9_AGRTU|nr:MULTISPECIES: Gfo/Idh/MocA family oxidoreductase [Agrobacterium]MCP2138026.1 myo-inositol 2-dehydrogenase/D-chiro-inositol 1-dehydrogenase [Rhizobium sp. SLBN-94]EPR23392.1 dehydrogenase [Agrobacterium radiobacter DSM 30147]KAB0459120.1 dehydrogenase [Agrobacterium tumefaciens]MBB4409405.1 myo-inositol 2-dehydrogenase/D-chiro-inositol 1-dehydrogenase [Agrobacterium radiobacter]MBB4454086.1 myo-inositol 2-dehydrogenase/D-chiro-inositol 1-dehydrogenase [Agrobacterium radiobacter]